MKDRWQLILKDLENKTQSPVKTWDGDITWVDDEGVTLEDPDVKPVAVIVKGMLETVEEGLP